MAEGPELVNGVSAVELVASHMARGVERGTYDALEYAVGATAVDGGWLAGWAAVIDAARAGDEVAVELLCVRVERSLRP